MVHTPLQLKMRILLHNSLYLKMIIFLSYPEGVAFLLMHTPFSGVVSLDSISPKNIIILVNLKQHFLSSFTFSHMYICISCFSVLSWFLS